MSAAGTPVDPDDVAAVVGAVAAVGLERSRWAPPARPLDDRSWASAWTQVRHRRLVGFLAASVGDGTWPVTEHQHASVRAAHRRSAAACLRLERLLLELHAELVECGVEHRLLKGAAHAHLLYPDPAMRTFVDVDLLVPGEAMATAGALLAARGGRRRYPEPRPGFDRRFTKGASYALAGGWEVDLHRTLAPGPFGLALDPSALLARRDRVVIGGVPIDVLDGAGRALHAAVHAVLGSPEPNPVALRDLAQAIECGVDVGEVIDLAEAQRAGPVLATASDLLVDRLRWEPPPRLRSWRAGRACSGRERRWLASYTGSGASVRKAVVAAEAVPGVRAKAAYLAAVVWPSDPGAHRSSTQRWRDGVASLRR